MNFNSTPPGPDAPATRGLDAIAFETDADGRLTSLSASWTGALGYEVPASLGRFLWSYLPEEEQAACAPEFRAVSMHPHGLRRRLRLKSSDGTLRDFHCAGRRRMAADGRIVGMMGSLQPADSASADDEPGATGVAFGYRLLDAIPTPIYVKDHQGRILNYNSAYADWLGINRDEWIGKTVYDIYPKNLADVFNASDEQLMQSGGAVVFESNVVSPKGRRGVGINHKAAFVDDQGQVAGVIGSFVDITERKEAEARIARSEAFLNRVIDALPDPVFVKDAAHRYVKVNEAFARLLGHPRDDVQGKSDPDFFPSAQAQEDWAGDDQVISSGLDQIREEHYEGPDGQHRIMSIKKSACLSTDDQPLVVGSSRDITELVASRDAAQAASRAKSAFLANMSHEIRTPLNGVVGIADLLLGTALDNQQRHLVQTLQQAGAALMSVINDILDLSKIEAGKLSLQDETFDPADVVEDVIELFAERAQSAGLTITSDIEADVPQRVQGDPSRLRQVLSNLVGNAIKFTARGVVAARLSLHGGTHIRFEVRDTGIGIAPELQSRIFQAFAQADEGANRRFGGAGLGLTISRDLVAMMGGNLGVDSCQGQGACFHFELPIQATPTILAAGSVTFPWRGRRALVVGDPSGEPGCLIRKLARVGVPARMMPSLEDAKACVQADGGSGWIVFVDGDALALSAVAQGEEWKACSPKAEMVLLVALTQAPLAESAPLLRKPVSRQSLLACLECLGGGQSARPLPPKPQVHPLSGSVLVVEDNPVNQIVATRIVKSLGCTVTLATNGREALARLDEESFDLVLMDCQMPEMDGLEATREIRRREAGHAHIPIVALTANAMDSDRRACLEAGMDDFLAKPFTRDQLRAMLEGRLRVRDAQS